MCEAMAGTGDLARDRQVLAEIVYLDRLTRWHRNAGKVVHLQDTGLVQVSDRPPQMVSRSIGQPAT